MCVLWHQNLLSYFMMIGVLKCDDFHLLLMLSSCIITPWISRMTSHEQTFVVNESGTVLWYCLGSLCTADSIESVPGMSSQTGNHYNQNTRAISLLYDYNCLILRFMNHIWNLFTLPLRSLPTPQESLYLSFCSYRSLC